MKDVKEGRAASFVTTAMASVLLLAASSLLPAGEECTFDDDCPIGQVCNNTISSCEPPKIEDLCQTHADCRDLFFYCAKCPADEEGNRVGNECLRSTPEFHCNCDENCDPGKTCQTNGLCEVNVDAAALLDEPMFRSNFDEGDAVVLGDANGDGVLDVIVAKDNNGQLEIRSSVNSFSAPIMQGLPDTSFDEGDTFKVGDVDGDGIDEIVIVDDETGIVRTIDLPLVQP